MIKFAGPVELYRHQPTMLIEILFIPARMYIVLNAYAYITTRFVLDMLIYLAV